MMVKGKRGYLLLITRAPITPGTQPQHVKRVTMMIEPQPLSKTASGGKMMHNNTRRMLMIYSFFDCIIIFKNWINAKEKSIIIKNIFLCYN